MQPIDPIASKKLQQKYTALYLLLHCLVLFAPFGSLWAAAREDELKMESSTDEEEALSDNGHLDNPNQPPLEGSDRQLFQQLKLIKVAEADRRTRSTWRNPTKVAGQRVTKILAPKIRLTDQERAPIASKNPYLQHRWEKLAAQKETQTNLHLPVYDFLRDLNLRGGQLNSDNNQGYSSWQDAQDSGWTSALIRKVASQVAVIISAQRSICENREKKQDTANKRWKTNWRQTRAAKNKEKELALIHFFDKTNWDSAASQHAHARTISTRGVEGLGEITGCQDPYDQNLLRTKKEDGLMSEDCQTPLAGGENFTAAEVKQAKAYISAVEQEKKRIKPRRSKRAKRSYQVETDYEAETDYGAETGAETDYGAETGAETGYETEIDGQERTQDQQRPMGYQLLSPTNRPIQSNIATTGLSDIEPFQSSSEEEEEADNHRSRRDKLQYQTRQREVKGKLTIHSVAYRQEQEYYLDIGNTTQEEDSEEERKYPMLDLGILSRDPERTNDDDNHGRRVHFSIPTSPHQQDDKGRFTYSREDESNFGESNEASGNNSNLTLSVIVVLGLVLFLYKVFFVRAS